jgi:hypothetical protein
VAVFDRDVKEDAPAALFRLLRYACSLGEGGRRSGLLARLARSCVSGLDGQAAGERFLALVDSWLDEVRRNRAVDPGAWQRVPVLREALCLVREALPAGGRLARHLELCSIHLRVELAAHGIFPLGEDEEGAIVARAEEIFDSPDLFDDVLGGFMARIEYMLMLVQHVHFNRIRFEGVEECLAPLERTHHDLLAHLQGSGFAGVRRLDALRGQLLGTLAQARAFLGCRPGCESLQRTALFTKAWELFEESLRHFPEGTRFWSQGNNYLVCLFWRFGYFNEALELHFRKADKPELRLLLSLGSKALGNVQEGSVRDWFICLNHLRLLATACRERMLGDPVRGADLSILVNEILAHEDSLRSVDGGYPFNLVLKWLAVIALQAPTLAPGATRGEIARLLELAVAEARGEPVLEAMRQVELLVLAVLRQEAGAREDLLDLDGLRAAVPEGWLDLSENLFGLAPAEVAWKVANGLPFYYA